MSAASKQYRFHLPKKAIKSDCPQCGARHRRTLSRYVDHQTGAVLPDEFGRCDRESNCGYHYSPYHKEGGQSYAEMIFEQSKATTQPIVFSRSRPTSTPEQSVPYFIPDEVFRRTLGHYEHNQFAALLRGHFGREKADDLLQRFQVGTCRKPSGRWPQEFATIFWLIDRKGKPRAGQVNQFAPDWHRAKYTNREGKECACISSVSHGLLRHYRNNGENTPDWLTDYHDNASRWPVPFGLHLLREAEEDHPVAIVEACKTAVVCAGYFPQFVWLAIGAKSYPNAERLADLKSRTIKLYPDLKAYDDWSRRAEVLRAEGFQVSVSSLLEDNATDEQREKGLDLADFLLKPTAPTPKIVKTLTDWAANPGSILRPDESQLVRL